MALIELTLPLCDQCGKPWLPVEEEAQQDIRAYDASRRAAGLPGVRCGKCKSFFWDDKNPAGLQKRTSPVGKKKPALETNLVAPGDNPRKRCKHGLRSCKECR